MLFIPSSGTLGSVLANFHPPAGILLVWFASAICCHALMGVALLGEAVISGGGNTHAEGGGSRGGVSVVLTSVPLGLVVLNRCGLKNGDDC